MADTDIKYTPPRVKSPILEKMKDSPGGPGGPGTPGAKKEIAEKKKALGVIKAQGGLAALLKQMGADAETVEAAELVESMPGGNELLYTMAGEELMKKAGADPKDAKKVRLYCYGGYVEQAFAKGGSVAAAAAKTKAAGRGDDSMMLHMSPEEYEVIEAMWGPAEINPNTGIGEYGFLSKVWKKVKGAVKKIFKSKIFQIVAPIALSMFAPGLGTAIGGMLTGGAGGAVVSSTVGNALIRGGLSAAGGGDFMSGAISGAVAGGLGSLAGTQVDKLGLGLSDSTNAIVGSALASGAGSSLTGGDFTEGALQGAVGQMMQPTLDSVTAKGQDFFGIEDPGAGGILARKSVPEGSMSGIEGGGGKELIGIDESFGGSGTTPQMSPIPQEEAGLTVFGDPAGGPVAPAPAGTPAPAAASGDMGNLIKYGLPAMALLGSGSPYEEALPPQLPEHFNESLPQYTMNREFQAPDPNAYYTYGQSGAPQSGQHLFMDPRPFGGAGQPDPTGGLGQGSLAQLMASGQPIPAQAVRGGGGRLRQAGYTQDPSTGNWMPPAPAIGQATGGYQEGEERFVSGAGTGRSDDIPARLSDGEYVIDAESVALLGDGSGSAGAKRLDEMRQNLRKHKAKNLAKGGFSHKAKSPANYMGQLRAAAGSA